MKINRNKDVSRITRVYKGMRERCNQKKHKSYKNYGGKGIKVLVSRLDFIAWYLENVTDDIESPQVDRIDPSKHYELSNMQILSATDNSKKTHAQNPEIRINYKKLLSEANKERSVKVIVDGIEYESCNACDRALSLYHSQTSRTIEKLGTNKFKTLTIVSTSLVRA